jgi:hypothetical protein
LYAFAFWKISSSLSSYKAVAQMTPSYTQTWASTWQRNGTSTATQLREEGGLELSGLCRNGLEYESSSSSFLDQGYLMGPGFGIRWEPELSVAIAPYSARLGIGYSRLQFGACSIFWHRCWCWRKKLVCYLIVGDKLSI